MTAISYHATIEDVQVQPLALAGPPDRTESFESIDNAQLQPLYAMAEDASGAVVLPLRRNGRRLESMLDGHGFAWRPLATPYGSSDSLTIALARDLAKLTSHVVFNCIPDEDGTARQLVRAFERAGWLVACDLCDAEDSHSRYRLRCWRRRDPRNWPAIGKSRLRMLVSRGGRR